MSPAVSGRPTAGVAAAVAVAAAAGLGTHTLGPVDAMHQVLSDAAVTPSGATALGTACAALVVAAGLLVAAARRTRWSGPVRALLALWAAGLIAVAVFPTNLPGTRVTTSAVIHRYGAAIAVAVPPLVALLVARTPRLRTVALGTGAMAAGYGLAHLPTILAGVAALPFTGLWERLLLGLVLLLVLLTSAELRQPEVSGSPGREMSLVHAGRDDEAGGRGDPLQNPDQPLIGGLVSSRPDSTVVDRQSGSALSANADDAAAMLVGAVKRYSSGRWSPSRRWCSPTSPPATSTTGPDRRSSDSCDQQSICITSRS